MKPYFRDAPAIGLGRRFPIILFGLCVSAENAFAHVKWFQPFDLREQPIAPGAFMALTPWLLGLALSLPAIWICVVLDGLAGRATVRRVLARWRAPVLEDADQVIRLAIGLWLSWLWLLPSPIWLTPELHAQAPALQWLQLALAGLCLSRRSAGLAGLGLIGLWLGAARQYGLYHLADYPLFLGLAAYLIGISVARMGAYRLAWPVRNRLGLLVAAMAWTLMWASIEKWAFAGWSLPLLCLRPYLTMGLSPEVFLTFSGWFEFGAAALLVLGGPVSSRLSAAVLMVIFASAVLEFGRVDLVGHFPIIVALLVTVWQGNGGVGASIGQAHRSVLQRALVLPVLYLAGLIAAGAAFLGGWAIAYGPGLSGGWIDANLPPTGLLWATVATALVLLLSAWGALAIGRTTGCTAVGGSG